MHTRLLAAAAALSIAFSGAAPALAQANDTMLVLAPHCTDVTRATCTHFDVADASHLRTAKLSVGDILDLDVVLSTSTPASVKTIRSWLSYDPTILEARSVELTPAFAAPFPGEQTADSVGRVVKIGGSAGTLSSGDTVLARVTFRVLQSTKNTEISFANYLPGGSGQTAVNGEATHAGSDPQGKLPNPPCINGIAGCKDGTTVTALLMTQPSTLTIVLTDGQASTPSATTAAPTTTPTPSPVILNGQSPTTTPSPAPIPSGTEGGASTFSLLQVQNVRLATRERDVFVGWSPLQSSALKGYNVYYGTVSGRYIQRKSVPTNLTSLVLRDLEPGTTEYIAVRAFDQSDTESAFSQEASITVGQPESSSSPLTGNLGADTVEGNPVANHSGKSVTGETGTGSAFAVFLMISAFIGTGFAFRRQLLLSPSHHV